MTLASSVASTVISNGTILLFYQDPAGNIQLTSRDWNSSLWSPSTLVTRDAKLFTPLATISSDTLSPIRLMYINNQQTLADVECIGQPCSWQNGTLSQKNVVPFQNTSLAVPAYNCTNFDLFYQDTDSSLMVARYQADSSSRWNITEVGYRNFLLGSSLAALDYDTTHQVRVYGQNLKVEATEYMTSDNLAWSTGSFKYQVGPEKPLLAASAINTTSLVSLHVFTIKNGQIEMTFHNGSASWAPLTFNNQQDFNSRIRTMNITAISVVTLNSPQEASNLYFTNTQGQLWELQMNPASGTWEPLNRTVLTDIVQPPPGPTGISGLGIAFITSAVLA
ncbi:uncharacterized protein BJ171DRAFT_276262 [Polychytrium aggregatum]|uniref:uncharacterized protein n=1 Tax=Polychytrium aggregatum TaxID=110093 RepID=UPI0022FE6115|nr:uncharacterized protein BJ171DRAFT_276262 [Polychytrium aggregatum]KAI9207480.1 hypothetical protein BJ171DRAFT_276262 [Polychytrium aggregatum]